MKIQKYKNLLQRIQYSKLYRAPKWLLKKLLLKNPSDSDVYAVSMRLGHKIFLRPTQSYLKNILYSGQYHDENIFMAEQFIGEGSTVLDIGANIGLYSCAYAEYYKDLNLRILAIEAVENNFKILSRNISENNFKNIESFLLALGKENGSLVLSLPSEDFVGNAVGDNINTQNNQSIKVEVPMSTLNFFAEQNNIDKCDFIKMDIEGAEYFVFEGGLEFIKKTRPVIQSEYNKHWIESIGKSFKDFYLLFKDLDYKIALEKSDSFEIIKNPETFEVKDGLVDLLFIPQEKL